MKNRQRGEIMNNDVLGKYSIALKDAEEVLSGKREPIERPPTWTEDERKRWKLRESECPLCNQEYTDNNKITKEHIHPLCLGGEESSHNITALCHQCNQSRNDMMKKVLAFKTVEDLRKRWPANRTSVQEFIVWCHATIFEDISVIRSFPHINEAFSIARNIDYPGDFDLEETTKIKSGITIKGALTSVSSKIRSIRRELRKNKKIPQKTLEVDCLNCKQKLRIPSDYAGDYRCPKCKFLNNQNLNQDSTDDNINPQPVNPVDSIPVRSSGGQDVLPIEDFRNIVLPLIPEEPVSLSAIAGKVTAYMSSKNYENTTTTAFLNLFGLPRGFKKALMKHLETDIRITGSEGKTKIQRIIPPKNSKMITTVEVKNDNSQQIKRVQDNTNFHEMQHRILTKDMSHVLFSSLSNKKMEAGALGGKMNNRLRDEKLIPENELFYSLYGLSKRSGLVKLIKSEYSEELMCLQDQDNENRYYVKLKHTDHLTSLKNELIRMGEENDGRVELISFWVSMNNYLENNSITRGDFQRQLGIPNKGTIQEKVWRIIERLDVPYSLEGFMIEGESPVIILHQYQS